MMTLQWRCHSVSSPFVLQFRNDLHPDFGFEEGLKKTLTFWKTLKVWFLLSLKMAASQKIRSCRSKKGTKLAIMPNQSLKLWFDFSKSKCVHRLFKARSRDVQHVFTIKQVISKRMWKKDGFELSKIELGDHKLKILLPVLWPPIILFERRKV